MNQIPANRTTVADVIAYWRTRRHRYEARSFANRDRILRRLEAALGGVAVAALRPVDLILWLNAQEGWGATTKNVVAGWVRSVFALAQRHELVGGNPAAELRRDFPLGEGRRPVTHAELRAMLRHSTDAPFRRFVTFLWWTGLRVGEASALRWPEVLEKQGKLYLRIEKHKTRKATRRAKVVPLMAPARKLLAWLRRQPDCQPEGPVFVNRVGTAWSPEALCNRLGRIRRQADIAGDCYFHGIRHAWGTNRVQEGAPIAFVSEGLGHGSVTITEEYYVHLDGQAEVEAIGRVLEAAADNHGPNTNPDHPEVHPHEMDQRRNPGDLPRRPGLG